MPAFVPALRTGITVLITRTMLNIRDVVVNVVSGRNTYGHGEVNTTSSRWLTSLSWRVRTVTTDSNHMRLEGDVIQEVHRMRTGSITSNVPIGHIQP